MEDAILTDWYNLDFLSCPCIVQVWSVNHESYFGNFKTFWQCLNVTGYLVLPYIEKVILTGTHNQRQWQWSDVIKC